jgi:hypothetical protein
VRLVQGGERDYPFQGLEYMVIYPDGVCVLEAAVDNSVAHAD